MKIILHSLFLISLFFPDCVYYIDQDPVCDEPTPIYHVLLSTEPDWCIYSQNDVVWKHLQISNNVVTPDGWYVYHASEFPHTPPPAEGPYAGEYGVDGCDLVQWPW